MKKNTVLINISFLSFLILFMAYFIEFGLGHKPCNLCILQRIPYAAAVVLLPFSIIFHKFKKSFDNGCSFAFFDRFINFFFIILE